MELDKVRINHGFWKKRKDLNINSSFYAVLNSFKKSGRIRALTNEHYSNQKPHIFWESDLAKLMEGAFFTMQQKKNKKLLEICNLIIDKIISNQEKNGYLNFYFSFHEPKNKFTNLRDRHELYCAGHLLESAIEHCKATGDKRFFNSIEKYIDHIISIFGKAKGKKRGYPGHQEIELALIKAYNFTKKKKFLDLAAYFIDERGTDNKNNKHYFIEERKKILKKEVDFNPSNLPASIRDFLNFGPDPHGTTSGKLGDLQGSVFRDLEYWQSHLGPINQNTAEGHSVRALYMFTAMADLARIN